MKRLLFISTMFVFGAGLANGGLNLGIMSDVNKRIGQLDAKALQQIQQGATLYNAPKHPATITSASTADGVVGIPFSYAITASNNSTSFYATGLPAGLAVNTQTGLISGVPAAAGTSTVIIGAITKAGVACTQALTLAIAAAPVPKPVITSAAIASGTAGAAFSYTIMASNSPASFGATGLPAGLAVNAQTGLISGTPSAAGTASVTLSAANAGGTGTLALALAIAAAPVPKPVLNSAAIASGTAGSAFTYTITASNSPTSFGATGLPAGLAVNTQTGIISGTPSASGTFSVTLSAANAGGAGTLSLTLAIAAAPVPQPVLNSAAIASGTAGSAFTYTITASNSPTSFGATGLPAGLAVNTQTGLISGTPSASGTFSAALNAANAGGTGTMTLTLNIAAAPVAKPVLSSASAASGTVGAAFAYTITASNSPTGFGATGLPAGLAVNAQTGLISGTPSASGTFSVTLSAANAGGTGTLALTLTIAAAPVAKPVLSSAATASGTVGTTFAYTITASNSPTSFGATGLPAGLAVNAQTGLISGTPSAAGTFSVALSAVNAGGTGTLTLTLNIAASSALKPVITSGITASGTVGAAFSYAITADNGPASFDAAGLPAGLTVNTITGVISGSPSAAGTFGAMLNASNAAGTGTQILTLTIAKAPSAIKTGAYTENNTTIETATEGFETWLNNGSVYALQYGGDASASDFTGSVPWALGLVPNNRKLLWSQPLIYTGATLAEAAAGSYDSAYASIAASLAAGYAQGKILVVRIGWEFNGGWYSWTTNGGQSANYVAAWRKLALAIRAKQPNIKFEWCPNWGQSDPTAAYPGDDVVDYVGMDAYEEQAYVTGTPDARWAGFLNHSGWDLTKMAAFAATHNKPMGISEYASDYNDGYFVSHMAEWIKSHNVDHHSYWNSTHPINTLLANYPVNQAAYYAAWGGAPTVSAPAITSAGTASGTVGSAFSYTVTATNSPTSFAASGLPAGLAINTQTGAISGAPAASGTYTVTLAAYNAGGSGTQVLTLNM